LREEGEVKGDVLEDAKCSARRAAIADALYHTTRKFARSA
jgi:hypothetical protein